jgi:cell division protease FtsH
LGNATVRSRLYSEKTAHDIDGALRELVENAFARALRILSENRALMLHGAKLLLEKETLTEPELKPLFSQVSPSPDEAPAAATPALAH